MSVACAALVAMVCFQGPVKVSHVDGGEWRSETIAARAFKAFIFNGDAYASPDRRQMSEACIEALCVRYHKYCVVTADAVRCEYAYAWPADEFLHTLTVSAASAESYADAERAIALVPPDRPESVQLALSVLGVAAAARATPMCPQHTDCWP